MPLADNKLDVPRGYPFISELLFLSKKGKHFLLPTVALLFFCFPPICPTDQQTNVKWFFALRLFVGS